METCSYFYSIHGASRMDLIKREMRKRQNRSKYSQISGFSLKIKALQKIVDSFLRLAQA